MGQLSLYELRLTCKELIDNLSKRIQEITNMLDEGSSVEASEKIVYLIDDLAVLSDGIDRIKEEVTGLELTELNEKLELLVNGLEDQNYLLVSDLMKFELIPLLSFWSGQLIDE